MISAGWTMPRRRAETIRLAALVERLQRPRRRVADLDHDAAAGRVEEAQDAVADAQLDHLDPEPVGHPRRGA